MPSTIRGKETKFFLFFVNSWYRLNIPPNPSLDADFQGVWLTLDTKKKDQVLEYLSVGRTAIVQLDVSLYLTVYADRLRKTTLVAETNRWPSGTVKKKKKKIVNAGGE